MIGYLNQGFDDRKGNGNGKGTDPIVWDESSIFSLVKSLIQSKHSLDFSIFLFLRQIFGSLLDGLIFFLPKLVM